VKNCLVMGQMQFWTQNFVNTELTKTEYVGTEDFKLHAFSKLIRFDFLIKAERQY